MNAMEPINRIYEVARAISRDTRARVQSEVAEVLLRPPLNAWEMIIEGRRQSGLHGTLSTAGKSLVQYANEPSRPFVKRAVKNLLTAVEELREYRPEYRPCERILPAADAHECGLSDGPVSYSTWAPTAASVSRLDELRDRVKVKLIELRSLFEWHNDPTSRFLRVAKEAAKAVLEPTAAMLVGEWLEKLERGEVATA